MRPQKVIIGFLSLLFLSSSLLFSQSLVELSKIEKERRERLINRKVTVITNATLRNLKKRPALTVTRPAVFGEELPQETAPPEEPTPEKTELSGIEGTEGVDIEKTVAALEEKWNAAKEMVVLLTTRINGLWQEFYSMDDMSDRGNIQKEISETAQKLEKVQQDEVKTKEELDKWRSQIKK